MDEACPVCAFVLYGGANHSQTLAEHIHCHRLIQNSGHVMILCVFVAVVDFLLMFLWF